MPVKMLSFLQCFLHSDTRVRELTNFFVYRIYGMLKFQTWNFRNNKLKLNLSVSKLIKNLFLQQSLSYRIVQCKTTFFRELTCKKTVEIL